MKILYLLTRELVGAGAAFRREHAKDHEVQVIDLLCEQDFERVVDAIAAADRVISW